MRDNIRRVSLACLPCRAKKVRCDGQRPACRTCLKNEIDCTFKEGSDQRKPYSKAYVKTLEARINALEAEVQKHKQSKKEKSREIEEESKIETEKDKNEETDSMQVEQTHSTNGESSQKRIEPSLRQAPALQSSQHVANDERLLDTMIRRGGCLSFKRDSSPGAEVIMTSSFYGASSGRNIPAMNYSISRSMPPILMDEDRAYRQEFYYERIRTYVDGYFEHHQPLLGLLDYEVVEQRLQNFGGKGSLMGSDLLLHAIAAIGSLSNQDHAACHFFMKRSMELLERENVRPRTTTVQALVLMALTEASLGCESRGWLYIGMASRIALEIGLPRDIHDYCRHGWIHPAEARQRHRTTWSLFIVDRLLALYYGRFPSIGPESISLTMPSRKRELRDSISLRCPYAPIEDGGEARLKGTCNACETFEPGFICLFELSTFSVDINARLYINPILSGEAATTWLDWASDMNLQLAKWNADLPPIFKCNFTRGRTPSPLAMHIQILYHSLIILLNRPFLALSAKKQEARFAAQSCHFSSREIVRLSNQVRTHHGFQFSHNFIVYALHASATISVINAKLGSGTIQREAKNDLLALFTIFRQLRTIHRNAALVLTILTDLVQAAFARDSFLHLVLSNGQSATGGTANNERQNELDERRIDDQLRQQAAQQQSTPPLHSSIDTLLSTPGSVIGSSSVHQSPIDQTTNDELSSQFAMVDWDLFATSTLSTVIDYLDVQPWLQL